MSTMTLRSSKQTIEPPRSLSEESQSSISSEAPTHELEFSPSTALPTTEPDLDMSSQVPTSFQSPASATPQAAAQQAYKETTFDNAEFKKPVYASSYGSSYHVPHKDPEPMNSSNSVELNSMSPSHVSMTPDALAQVLTTVLKNLNQQPVNSQPAPSSMTKFREQLIFTGTPIEEPQPSWRTFLAWFEEVTAGEPDKAKTLTLLRCLKGYPLELAMSVETGTPAYQRLQLLEQHFAPILSAHDTKAELNRRQAPGEHVMDYLWSKVKLQARVKVEVFPFYIDGIYDNRLRALLTNDRMIGDMDDAVAATRHFLRVNPSIITRPPTRASQPYRGSRSLYIPRDSSGRILDKRTSDNRPVCNYCRNPGHLARECPARFNGQPNSRNAVRTPTPSLAFQSSATRPSSFETRGTSHTRSQQFAPRNQRRDLTGTIDTEYEYDDDTVACPEESLPMEFTRDLYSDDELESKNEVGVRSADPFSDQV